MGRIKENVGRITRTEFQPIAALQFLALDALPVHERAMLAAQIFDEEFLTLLHDLSMVARDSRIGDDEVLIHLAADGERSAIQNDILLLATLHKHKGGKHSGAGAVMALADCIEGHGLAGKKACSARRSPQRGRVQLSNQTTLTPRHAASHVHQTRELVYKSFGLPLTHCNAARSESSKTFLEISSSPYVVIGIAKLG